MTRAMELLRQSRLPLGRVAESAGYQSAAAFGKAFKKFTGRSPRRFRRLERNRPHL